MARDGYRIFDSDAHLVTGARLDLDDVRAEQGRLIAAERPGHISGEVEDANAREGFFHRGCPCRRS